MCSIILNITDVTGQASNGKNFVISSALYTYIEYVIGANMYLVIFVCYRTISWVSHLVASGKATETQDADVGIMFCPKFWVDYYMLIYIHHMQLMMSVGSYGSF